MIHWLTSSVLAGSSLSAALPAQASQPYLATISPLPLRFAPPPPDLSTEPAPAAPPNPDGVIGEVAQSNQEAIAPVPLAESGVAPSSGTTPDSPIPDAASADPALPAESAPPAPSRPPVEILPDDLSRPVSPEELLPFFLPPQLPAGPTSQATYRQK